MTVKALNAKRYFLSAALLCLVVFSCRQMDLVEQSNPFPRNEWKSPVPSKGQFVISDTSAAYNIYIVLRHTDAYRYNNIWLNIGIQAPGDPMSLQKINLPLGNDASGWEGSGMNDIWEIRKIINGQPLRFKKAGLYHFSLYQIMRDDPLLNVMSAGLRIEKVVQIGK